MMKENKLALFEEKEIRREWYNEDWYFSIIDVVEILAETDRPRKYWSDLKQKLITEGCIEVSEKIGQLKLSSKDGKKRLTDVANTKGILRIIQSIPSPKAEPFKLWLAQVGNERLEEIVNPELAINRAKETYVRKGYEDTWIVQRLKSIDSRKELTDTWKVRGAKNKDYAILTDEIYKSTFNMSTAQYKKLKGINKTKRNLRDSMGKLELAITNLAEVTANEIHNTNDSFGLENLKDDVQEAGKITGKARKDIEQKIGKNVVEGVNYKNLTTNKLKKIKNKEKL
ncbi:MAG: Bro-N domain-containing protein [Clostridia bacterium]|nr:Bro-N domain-containing protein [Clostridia bacterium]